MGEAQGSPCINNVWIPDGYKESPANRSSPRARLLQALDAVFAEPLNPKSILDAVECKLFGIGSESYVVGSHEFYLGYAITRKKLLCLDAGHFHPTEGIADKISSVLLYVPELLLHVSRGVRWDSDHVVTFSDELQAITQRVVRGDFLNRVHIGMDYFDASINRIAAWVIALAICSRGYSWLCLNRTSECDRQRSMATYTTRLALMEELKSMPYAAVWDYHCLRSEVPVGIAWLERVQKYESDVLLKRS